MAGYIGSKAVNLSTTGADINGDANIDGTLTSDGLTVNSGTNNIVAKFESSDAGAFIILEDSGSTNDGNRIAVEGDVMSFATGDSERMRITSSGSVGIGTSSPSTTLEVKGADNSDTTLTVTGGTTAGLGSNAKIKLVPDGTAGVGVINAEGSDGNDVLAFQTNGTEAMRITSAGNVGIGTASPTPVSGSVALEIEGVGSQAGAEVIIGSADTTATAGDLFGGLAFKSIDSNGTAPHYSGIKATAADTFGGANLEFYAGRSNYESNDPRFVIEGPQSVSGEAMRLDASGNLLVGTTNSNVSGNSGSSNGGINIQTAGVKGVISAAAAQAVIYLNRLGTSDGDIAVFRKDGSTVGSISSIGGLYMSLDSPQGTGYLSVNGALRYGWNNSTLYPNTDNARDLGLWNRRWDDIYVLSVISTSDRNEKQDIAELSDAEQRVAVAAKGLMRKFRWRDAVEAKGDDARTHFGIIAQDLQAAFATEGLDAGDYAMFISTTWWETQTEVPAVEAVAEVLDEEGNVVTEAVEAKDAYTRTDTYETQEEAPEGAAERTRLGVRYSELLAFIIGAL